MHKAKVSFHSFKGEITLYISKGFTLCGAYSKDLSKDNSEVTCKKCISILECEHDFQFSYRERYGWNKGDYVYKCMNCNMRVHSDFPLAKADCLDKCDQKLKRYLIWNNFKWI